MAVDISTVFTYFNPTRSPYYTIGLATCISLFFACDVDKLGPWLALFVPALLVAALTLALSMDAGNNLTPEEHVDQLRFARSACISVAVSLCALGEELSPARMPNPLISQSMS